MATHVNAIHSQHCVVNYGVVEDHAVRAREGLQVSHDGAKVTRVAHEAVVAHDQVH